MKKAQFKMKKNSGFSLGELLITVAILVVLMAVALPAVLQTQKNLRQKELDAKAEIIYVAAQNAISKLKAGGRTAVYEYQEDGTNGVKQYPGVPGGADAEMNITSGDICYITSAGGKAAAEILAQDVVDDELRGNHWVVEYNPSSAIVYAVFYSADRANCADEYSDTAKYNTLREKKNRLSDGARVGYYGGGSAANSSNVNFLSLTVNIINAEKLVANISCLMPGSSDYPVFKVDLSDGTKTITKYYAFWGDRLSDVARSLGIEQSKLEKSITQSGCTFNLELVLDDLSDSNKRFHAQYSELKAGTALTVTVTAMCPLDHTIAEEQAPPITTNSLFAYDPDGLTNTAVISYGRHLQNLDESSGVDASITKAEQNSNITFTMEMPDTTSTDYRDWYETYNFETKKNGYFNGKTQEGLPNFKPIRNSNLTSFDGKTAEVQYLIENLTVEAKTDAGLFETLGASQKVQNVRLTGSKVKSTEEATAAGALVGKVTDNIVSIENCQVYLTKADCKGKDNHDVWIGGNTAGGLIGTVAGGSVTVTKSSASTVVGGHTFDEDTSTVKAYNADSVGGLIGSVTAGTASLEESYADCYLFGHKVGGLVGDSNRTVTLNSCYAAGFETFKTEGAGMVCGDAEIDRSYTVMYPMYTANDKTYYRTAKTGKATGNVFYLTGSTSNETGGLNGSKSVSEMTLNGLKNGSNNAFSVTGSVTSYNLMNQALVQYDYPLLKNVKHYGDWVANFQPGALVYYEAYSNRTYGFYGANVESTLKDDPELTVVGDGYGVVYKANTQEGNLPDTVQVKVKQVGQNGNETDVTPESQDSFKMADRISCPVTGTDNAEYKIYPLSTNLVNTTTASDKFYLKAEVQSGNKIDKFYFNPHFAKTVRQDADETPELEQVSIRTARHLYMLSLYYGNYAAVTKGLAFEQERNIDYSSYHWKQNSEDNGFSTRTDDANSQRPIAGEETDFQAVYEGNCNWITNVSFETDTGLYVGFIGRNNGTVRNVVLTATYDENSTNNYNVRRSGTIASNETVYMGVLVGKNSGTITNCAVAGYYIAGSDGTIHAYENSYFYGGGLVGGNDGTIARCSADTPEMRLSSNFARAYLGGFVGENSSYISDCYALGHIEVAFAKGGSVSIAGFAGSNSGRIQTSYCATALTAVGEVTTAYGFAPYGGQVNTCKYLNNGTYAYVNHMYPFNFDHCAGDSATFAELRTEGKKAPAVQCYEFNNTRTTTKQYPFRAVVRDAKGNLVQYGDWLDDENMGLVGIFYWEHEEGGSNNGYHFTYLGIEDNETMGGTTLCNAHDDGSVITEYGYGYFELSKGSVSELKLEGATINGQTSFSRSENNTQYNQAASKALSEQMHKSMDDGTEMPYTFYAFTTSTDANIVGALCMQKNYKEPNCTWTLTWKSESQTKKYKFTVSPFFANAMRYVEANMTEEQKAGLQVTAFDGTVTDYSQEPGVVEQYQYKCQNQYEIRSIQQLQYINWRYDQANYMDTDSEKTEQYFFYECGTGVNQKYYSQTHDVKNTETGGMLTRFYPLGRAWRSFKEQYNGNSYQIKNLYIEEPETAKSSYIGLFGEVGGGTVLENIILTADDPRSAIISHYGPDRNDTNKTTYREPVVGSLVGMVWVGNGQTNTITIKNCAASGYTVKYAGSVKIQAFGRYISVGGLVGSMFSGTLENCTAVNTVVVDNAVDTKGTRQQLGGLIGTTGIANGNSNTASKIINCYSGGTIIPKTEGNEEYLCGGLIGNANGYDQNKKLQNDKKTIIKNCYTYCNVPESSVINSINKNNNTPDYNGYHFVAGNYTGTGSNTDTTTPYYKRNENKDANNIGQGLTYKDMSDGTLLGKLGDAFKPVTTTEGSADVPINGKYSFPGSNAALVGKNYPFPAVIQQRDLTFNRDVYVHYGDWPIDGSFWSNGRDSMDIFADMQTDPKKDNAGYAVKTYYLNPNGTTLENLETSSFTCSPGGIAKVVAVGEMIASGKEYAGTYPVTIKALNTGTTVVKLKDTTAEFALQVTAEIKVTFTSEPEPLRLEVEKTGALELSAQSITDDTKTYETNDNTTWAVAVVEKGCENLVTLTDPTKVENKEEDKEEKAKNQWTVKREGLGSLTLKATFTYDYPSTQDANKVQFTGVVYIDMLQPDTLGLSDGDKQYNAVYPGLDAALDGQDVHYTDSVKPQVEGADFFLYLDAETLKMEELTIQSILVNGTSATPNEQTGNVYTAGNFHIELDSPTADTMYQYRSGSIWYLGDGETPQKVKLTVVVNVGKTEETTGTDYTLNITLSEVKKAVTATFQDGSTENYSFTTVLSVGTHKLPTQEEAKTANEIFAIPTGQMLAGWKAEGEDESVASHLPGEVYDFTHDVNFTAAWVKAVNVTLDANGGQFQKKAITKVIQVPENGTFSLEQYAPTRTGYTLAGWNTAVDGTGISYNADATVQVTEIGTKPTLYAQWNPTLTLIRERGTTEFTEVNGSNRLARYYKADCAHPDGYELVGWYTAPDENRTMILDQDGIVVAEKDGYTEKREDGTIVLALKEPQKLYACWENSTPKYVLTYKLVDDKDYLLVSTNDPNEPAETSVAFSQSKYNNRQQNQQDQEKVPVTVKDSGSEKYIEIDNDGYAVFKVEQREKDSEEYYLHNELGYLNVNKSSNSAGDNFQYSFGTDKNTATAWAYFGENPGGQEYNQYVLIDKQSDWEKNDNSISTRRFTYTGRLYREHDQWSPDGFTVKATKDTKNEANANMYIYEKADHNYVFSGADSYTTTVSRYSSYSTRAAAPAQNAALTLMDGTRTVLNTAAPSGVAPITGYTAPTRANSEWTLEGWYTAKDGTGTKILNADGTATGDTLSGDATLYACWTRETNIFVKTDTLEPDADYLLVLGSGEEARAVGQVGETVVGQPVTAYEPGDGGYEVYDAETGDWSHVDSPYINVFSDQTVWHYAVDGEGNGTLTATDGSTRNNALWELDNRDISIYRRTTVRERSFEDEYLVLTLCTGTDCVTEVVTVADGAWSDAWSEVCRKLENGWCWFDSPDGGSGVQVLDAEGRFAAENVADYVKDGRWVYDGGSLTLYARTPELPEAEPMDVMLLPAETEEDKKKRTPRKIKIDDMKV